MKNVTVIGAGTMGNGIAHVFAQSGFNVTLVDVREEALEKALATIGRNLDRLIKKEKISEADKSATLNRIATATDIAAGSSSADLVVEAATERLDLKLSIFKAMDADEFRKVGFSCFHTLHTLEEPILSKHDLGSGHVEIVGLNAPAVVFSTADRQPRTG